MPFSLEDEWVFVACGMIAHADGVLEADECDRLLGLLGEETEGEQFSDWLTFFSDKEAMARRYASMPEPPEGASARILEQAWGMAMVDGEHARAEIEVLHQLAERFGLEAERIDSLRALWDGRMASLAELTAELAAYMLSGEGELHEDDRPLFRRFIARLPTNQEHREVLGTRLERESPSARAKELAQLDRRMRAQVVRLLATLCHDGSEGADARGRFFELAKAAGLARGAAERVLQATD